MAPNVADIIRSPELNTKSNSFPMQRSQKLRVVILTGTGSRFVEPLLRSGHDIVGIVEPRDSTEQHGVLKGLLKRLYKLCRRDYAIRSPWQLAEVSNIPYLALDHGDSALFAKWLEEKEPDILAVYMGPILKEMILQIPKHGTINIHPSLLPRYRGGHPILWMYYFMDLEAGVTVHFLDKGIDTGDIIYQRGFPVELGMTEDEVEKIAVERYGIPLMVNALDAVAAGNCPRVPQPLQSPTPIAKRVSGENYWKMIDWEGWGLERTWHFLRCTPLWRYRLPTPSAHQDAFLYRIGEYERVAHNTAPGTLQQDRKGLFFTHRDGKIRIVRSFSMKAFLKKILS